MTHGGAGAFILLFFLLVLGLPIVITWVLKGEGNKTKRKNVFVIQLIFLISSAIALLLPLESVRAIAFLIGLIVGISMLMAPILFRRFVQA